MLLFLPKKQREQGRGLEGRFGVRKREDNRCADSPRSQLVTICRIWSKRTAPEARPTTVRLKPLVSDLPGFLDYLSYPLPDKWPLSSPKVY